VAATPFKLRDDLVVSRQRTTAGAICFVVKDPANRRFFRLKEAEYEIVRQLDGPTSLDAIRATISERLGAPLSPETLERFLQRLNQLGLLETEGQAGSGHRQSRKVRGSLLYLRLMAFDPDALLTRLVDKVRFLFTPYFVVLSAALILAALGITVANSSEIGHDLLGLYRLQAIVAVWVTVVLVVGAHEFAHGLTCKRFGGEVHEMGFLLLYFQPAFYCNVSDAWLFPEKSKRLWVTFAGAYLEIVVWALATVIWRVTDPDTAPNYVALIVMATSGVTTLFNLNPLIKLDGYYLLGDYLEIPNLRQRAFTYLRSQVGRLTGSALGRIAEASRREHRIYLTYGLLAASYSFFILGFVALQLGGYLTQQYQGMGFLSFALLLGVALGNPLRRVVTNRDPVPAPAPPETGTRLPAWMTRRARLLELVAVVAITAVFVRMELKVSGGFTILPVHNADVRAEVDGIIAAIYKDEGDVVGKGDVIARLEDREYLAELRKTEAEIAEKQAKLKMLKLGARREEIELARGEADTAKVRQEHAGKWYEDAGRMHAAELAKAQTAAEKAEQRLAYAKTELGRLEALFASGLVPRKDVETAGYELAVRQKELEEVQAALTIVMADDFSAVRKERDLARQDVERGQGRLKVLLAGSRPEEVEASEAEIARLEVQRGYLQQELQRTQVSSPAAGVITTARLKERLGQRVSRGDLIAKVHEQKTVTAEILVSEKEIADVRVGQPVVLKARAHPSRSFSSRVIAIAPIAFEQEGGPGGRFVKVTAEIDNASGLLKSEMTGNAKIYGGKRRMIDLMTRRLARYVRVEFWSWW